MSADTALAVFVPICCQRIMRCNTFRLGDGGSYAALVCTICNKTITLEQEPLSSDNDFGENTSVLRLLAAPRPPRTERKKSAAFGADEPTL